jgi:hypothetical protein
MQYILLIYSDEAAWDSLSEGERGARHAEYGKLTGDLRTQGKLVGGDELQPIATATTVQVRKGETLVSDGPFAETKEALGGYYLIDAESLDEAIEWAARIPSAREGKIEIRPIVDHAGAGA